MAWIPSIFNLICLIVIKENFVQCSQKSIKIPRSSSKALQLQDIKRCWMRTDIILVYGNGSEVLQNSSVDLYDQVPDDFKNKIWTVKKINAGNITLPRTIKVKKIKKGLKEKRVQKIFCELKKNNVDSLEDDVVVPYSLDLLDSWNKNFVKWAKKSNNSRLLKYLKQYSKILKDHVEAQYNCNNSNTNKEARSENKPSHYKTDESEKEFDPLIRSFVVDPNTMNQNEKLTTVTENNNSTEINNAFNTTNMNYANESKTVVTSINEPKVTDKTTEPTNDLSAAPLEKISPTSLVEFTTITMKEEMTTESTNNLSTIEKRNLTPVAYDVRSLDIANSLSPDDNSIAPLTEFDNTTIPKEGNKKISTVEYLTSIVSEKPTIKLDKATESTNNLSTIEKSNSTPVAYDVRSLDIANSLPLDENSIAPLTEFANSTFPKEENREVSTIEYLTSIVSKNPTTKLDKTTESTNDFSAIEEDNSTSVASNVGIQSSKNTTSGLTSEENKNKENSKVTLSEFSTIALSKDKDKEISMVKYLNAETSTEVDTTKSKNYLSSIEKGISTIEYAKKIGQSINTVTQLDPEENKNNSKVTASEFSKKEGEKLSTLIYPNTKMSIVSKKPMTEVDNTTETKNNLSATDNTSSPSAAYDVTIENNKENQIQKVLRAEDLNKKPSFMVIKPIKNSDDVLSKKITIVLPFNKLISKKFNLEAKPIVIKETPNEKNALSKIKDLFHNWFNQQPSFADIVHNKNQSVANLNENNYPFAGIMQFNHAFANNVSDASDQSLQAVDSKDNFSDNDYAKDNDSQEDFSHASHEDLENIDLNNHFAHNLADSKYSYPKNDSEDKDYSIQNIERDISNLKNNESLEGVSSKIAKNLFNSTEIVHYITSQGKLVCMKIKNNLLIYKIKCPHSSTEENTKVQTYLYKAKTGKIMCMNVRAEHEIYKIKCPSDITNLPLLIDPTVLKKWCKTAKGLY